MSEKKADQKEFEIKRITTPQGDVPTVESVMEALNLIINRIQVLSRDFNERLKYSGSSIEASGYIEENLLDTNRKISELKKNLVTNSDQIEAVSGKLTELNQVVNKLEKMTKDVVGSDFTPQSKSYEEIIEIKKMTRSLKDSVSELHKSFGEGFLELEMLYWEYKKIDIKENLNEIAAYENEKKRILNFFKLLNLPKPVIEINAKLLLYGPSGTGKTSLIKAIAKDQSIRMFELNLPLIISLRPSKQVESLNSLFHHFKYTEEFKPCAILLDNFEMLYKIQDNSLYLPFIETLILEISRIHLTRNKILIIGILNNIEHLEPRLLDQFNEKIELKLPDQISRTLMLRNFLNEVNLEIDVDLDEISSKLAEDSLTDEFSGKELKEVFNLAKLQSFSDGRTLINENDLKNAIEILKNRKSQRKMYQEHTDLKGEISSKGKMQNIEQELNNVKMLLTNSTRMMKHALRLALTDNFNFVNRLFNHYEATKKPLTIDEICQVSGQKEENILKFIQKMPYRLLFPKTGEYYYVIFDKATLEEILAELALSI